MDLCSGASKEPESSSSGRSLDEDDDDDNDKGKDAEKEPSGDQKEEAKQKGVTATSAPTGAEVLRGMPKSLVMELIKAVVPEDRELIEQRPLWMDDSEESLERLPDVYFYNPSCRSTARRRRARTR